ncbi:ThiF family adenylyltransferase [Priestia megaterium]|uniref:ThiF family adenylyltransferase n=1 Tax=Priestia megaterium TaxID=1404 RepID=UPI002E231013|nr:ThiF family adenylyltransferase [Priestia megaterium]MED4284980.1 ThiF family adenylyltransferase [Priestia megaterium]
MTRLINRIKEELDTSKECLIRSFKVLENVDSSKYGYCSDVAEIEIEVNGKPAVLAVGFPDMFPNVLPKFFDVNNEFGHIPHKMPNGFLCFTRSDSLIIDDRYPVDILLHCLKKVITLIEDGVSGRNKLDFIDEFEVYWHKSKSIDNVHIHLDTDNKKLRELDMWWDVVGKGFTVYVAAEKNQPLENAVYQFFGLDIKKSIRNRCIYFPLEEGTFLMPPAGSEEWDFQTLKINIFNNLSDQNKKEFSKIAKRKNKDIYTEMEFIIIGIPTQKGATALFGCSLKGHSAKAQHRKRNKVIQQMHPFLIKPKENKVTKLNIKRWHPNFLLNRTGGNTGLKDKHVLIAGVGSVGSEIAMRFAKSGVRKLSLVDPDEMEVENIHRHAVGSNGVFTILDEYGLVPNPKVLAVEKEIKQKYPFTEIKSYWEGIKKTLEDGLLSKERVDLIIIAIGSVNMEMSINQMLHRETNSPPVVYTWVEPLGIGGHTLVTLNGEKQGCYQCLFKEREGEALHNRSAFAKPFQEFSKALTGCGSVFTPYNFLDSERSALMTVDAGIKILMGQLKGNPLLSWKGEDALFLEAGYETTPRYTFSTDELFNSRYLYKDDVCRVCSETGSDSY